MGYLSAHEHDIFVSYAHSDQLNAWSKRLIDDVRGLVAIGLGLREADQIGLWWDYKLSGHEPLTSQLREKAEKSALLLVLMSEWYLESSWCRDEVEWFINAVQQKRARRPVFIVRVRPTDHNQWPAVFKDERGHPLKGYDFVRNREIDNLGLPRGYPRPEDASDGKEYHEALSKLASDIVLQLKGLRPDVPSPRPPGVDEDPPRQERVCLAAAPAEDADDLRAELAALLRAKGCIIVPEENPLDLDTVRQRAPDWVSGCDKFVQVLGRVSGPWRYDETGFVMYQYALAQKIQKPAFVYRAPELETALIKKSEYRKFLESLERYDTGDLASFAESVIKYDGRTRENDASRQVFVMADERDRILESEIRRLLEELKIDVLPLPRRCTDGRDVKNVKNERSFLNLIRRCGGILLIHGSVKEIDDYWIDDRVSDIKFDIQRKLGGHPPYAIVDAPPNPRLESSGEMSVFLGDSPTFRNELQSWLKKLTCSPAAFKEA